jgi:hypothetical protein
MYASYFCVSFELAVVYVLKRKKKPLQKGIGYWILDSCELAVVKLAVVTMYAPIKECGG